MRIWLAMMVAISFLAPAMAALDPKDLVKAQLLTDSTAVKPGESFQVGILLKIKPQWHVYWTNPGDSGLATKIDLKVSDAKVGEIQYPVPHMWKQPGDIIGYGYEEEVMLLANVDVPKEAKLGSELNISADASWLVCHDICLPGREKLEATVKVAAEKKSQNDEAFDRWRNSLPVISTMAQEVENIFQEIDQTTAPTKAKGKLNISVTWKSAAPAEIEFYPPASPTAEFTVDSIKTDGNRTAIIVSFEAESLAKDEKRFPQAILAYKTDSKRRGVAVQLEIDRPLLPASATKPTASAADK